MKLKRMQLLRRIPRLLQTRLLPRIPRLRRLLLSKDYLTYDKKDIGRLVNVFFMLCVHPAANVISKCSPTVWLT